MSQHAKPTDLHTKGFDQTPERMAHYNDPSAAQRAMLALDAGRMGSWSWDIKNSIVTGDPYFADLFELDYDKQPWPVDQVFVSIHPDDIGQVQSAIDIALKGADIYETEFRRRIVGTEAGNNGSRWLGGRGNVTERDNAGEPLRMIGVNWDATRQKMNEQRLEMLAAEMDHRVKNAFAVMRALVNLGARASDDKAAFVKTIRGQVEAMAAAHAISARMARDAFKPSMPAPIEQILKSALLPWIEEDLSPDTTVQIIAEPSHVVGPDKVASLSMLIYELVTNATKYGALGERGGTLAISLFHDAAGAVVIDWSEICTKPPQSNSPPEDATGFGTILVSHCVAMLGGKISKNVTDDGVNMTISLPPE